METTEFIDRLVGAVPELEDVFEEHLRDYDAALPHVFMGDVARHALRLHVSESESDARSLEALLHELEAGLRDGIPEIRELVAVSFLENLDPQESATKGLREKMGFTLRRGLDRIHER